MLMDCLGSIEEHHDEHGRASLPHFPPSDAAGAGLVKPRTTAFGAHGVDVAQSVGAALETVATQHWHVNLRHEALTMLHTLAVPLPHLFTGSSATSAPGERPQLHTLATVPDDVADTTDADDAADPKSVAVVGGGVEQATQGLTTKAAVAAPAVAVGQTPAAPSEAAKGETVPTTHNAGDGPDVGVEPGPTLGPTS